MVDPKTLRGRLTLAYALALIVALTAFAALALLVTDRVQRNALDAQLLTVARAVGAIASESEGRVLMDSTDREQFAGIAGVKANAAVFQRDGTPVVASGYAIPPLVAQTAATVTRPQFVTVRVRGEDVRLFVTPVLHEDHVAGAIAVWRDAQPIEALDRTLALGFAIAIPVLAALAIAFGAAIARRGLEPLDRIATLVSEIEAHDLSQRIALPPRDDELGRLAATFDRMLDRLQRAFSRERQFTGDASHELRAPLSVIRAEADLALRRDREPGEYRRALEVIAAEADALEALTRDLLAAARADAEMQTRRDPVDLKHVADAAVRRLASLARERDVSLAAHGGVPAIVAGDPDALERAVVTVVHNAIKFARAGGAVELRVERAGGFVELSVLDDGPGFSPEALRRAFDRFWRDDGARGNGTGLGLAIARATVERAGGTIALANRPGGGAAVRFRFAAQPPDGARS